MPCCEETGHFTDVITVHSAVDAGDSHDNEAVAHIRKVQIESIVCINESPFVHGHCLLQTQLEVFPKPDALCTGFAWLSAKRICTVE